MESVRGRMFLASRTHFEVLGLEAYKSSIMSCPLLENGTFFDSLKIVHGHDLLFTLPWKSAETSREIWKDLFFFLKVAGKIFLGGEHLRLMSLALRGFVLEKSVLRFGLRFFLCPWPRRLCLDSTSG